MVIMNIFILCRYLASGNSLTDIAEKYNVVWSTTGNIVQWVYAVIWDLMREECIPIPTMEKWSVIAKCFQEHFPNCIGAMNN